jgi:hypothetical protein
MNIENLYSEKIRIMKELLAYIKSKKFTGTERDVVRYEKYVNKKNGYIEQMKKIDSLIRKEDAYTEVSNSEIMNIARLIADEDNKISEIMNVLMEELKVKSRTSRINRKVNSEYGGYNADGFSVFDFKG